MSLIIELSEVFTSGVKLKLISNRCAMETFKILSFGTCLEPKMP